MGAGSIRHWRVDRTASLIRCARIHRRLAQHGVGGGLVDPARLHEQRLGLVDRGAVGERALRLVQFGLQPGEGMEASHGQVDQHQVVESGPPADLPR